MATAVRMVDGTDDMVEGLGMPFGGPFGSGQDLYGEHFSKSTDFAFPWFPEDGRPILFHHGLDFDAGIAPVGRVKSYEVKADLGVWTKAQLDKSSEYFGAIKDLVKAGKLFFSSGAMAHLVDVDKRSGEIKRWPWVELTLTPTPANLLAAVDFATASRHYKSAGLELPEAVKAEMDAQARNQLSDSDFAYIDSNGGRHLPIHDRAHVQAAMARFNQTAFESDDAKAKARRKILSRAREMDMDVSEAAMPMKAMSMEMMQMMAEEMGMDMSEADMQAMVNAHPDADEAEMRRLMQRRAGRAAPSLSDLVNVLLDEDSGLDFEPVPIGLHAEATRALAASLLERTKGLQQRRLKEGRVISDANRKRLMACMDQMGAAMSEMQHLLDSSAPQPAKAAALRRQADYLTLWAAANNLPQY